MSGCNVHVGTCLLMSSDVRDKSEIRLSLIIGLLLFSFFDLSEFSKARLVRVSSSWSKIADLMSVRAQSRPFDYPFNIAIDNPALEALANT